MRAIGARTDERPRRKRGPDFSGAAGKGESENPGGARSTGALLTSNGHFFGDFLCVSKKSYPPQAEALHFEDRQRHWITASAASKNKAPGSPPARG